MGNHTRRMISKKVYDLEKEYKENSTKVLEGLERNQWDIIKRVYHYKNDSFIECSDPDAIFWQVVTPYLPHYASLLDLDPKDFNPKGHGKTNVFQAWILRKKLHNWFDQKGKISGDDFGVFLDDLTKNITTFGSYIVKINKKTDEPEFVDLRHIAFDPEVKTIRGKDKVEFHYLTEDEIRKKEWDNTDKVIENAHEKDDKKEIWEFVGEYDGDYVHVIGAGEGDKEVIAFEFDEKPEDDPYYDIHLTQYEGMWLRKGIYEQCFQEQFRANDLVNHNAKATEIASLLLLRSKDPKTSGNVLQQAVSGQIINSEDLQQIGIDNRAFTTLLKELEIIQEQVRKKLQLPDIATGETLPSGTPFRGMALMSSSQKNAFKQKRSRVATGVLNIIERILPTLVKEWNRGDMIEITEDNQDLESYDEAIRRVTRKNVYQKANEKGVEVTEDIQAKIEKMVDEKIEKKGRKIEIPKGFFNFEFGMYIDPVGEVIDKAQQNDAIINALQLIMQNPTIMELPIFTQLLENNNIPPFKLEQKVRQQIQQQQPDQNQMQSALRGLNIQNEQGAEATNQTNR